jgi:branched-chain amino acid transport system substrate-binding protein
MDGTGPAADALSITISNVWAKWTNAHGGINGHPVQLIVLDDASTPATALSDAKELVEKDHVIALIGSGTSTGGAALRDYLAQMKVPEIGGNFGSTQSGPYVYATGVSQGALSVSFFTAIKATGHSKYADFYCTESPNCSTLITQHKQNAALVGGIDVLFDTSISGSAPDYTSNCLKLVSSGADALGLASFESVAARLIPACAQQGYKGAYFLSATTVNPNWDNDPTFNSLDIYLNNAVWNSLDQATPEQKAYTQAVKQYSPAMLTSDSYTANEPVIWVANQMFAAAAKAGNIGPDSTPADMINALGKIQNETLGGTTGPISYNTADSVHADPCYFVLHISKGTWTDPLGPSSQCLSTSQFNPNPNG